MKEVPKVRIKCAKVPKVEKIKNKPPKHERSDESTKKRNNRKLIRRGHGRFRKAISPVPRSPEASRDPIFRGLLL
jgi:hypothetical protein